MNPFEIGKITSIEHGNDIIFEVVDAATNVVSIQDNTVMLTNLINAVTPAQIAVGHLNIFSVKQNPVTLANYNESSGVGWCSVCIARWKLALGLITPVQLASQGFWV